jgi:CRP-like cAMP-binding protein
MDGLPRSASVVALTDVRVRAVAPLRFTELLQAHPFLARHVAGLLEHRARRRPDEGRGPVGQSAPVARIARWLLERTEADGDWVDLSLGALAADVGASRELLSRAIDHLVGRGAVALDRGRVLVRSRAALELLAATPTGAGAPWPGAR